MKKSIVLIAIVGMVMATGCSHRNTKAEHSSAGQDYDGPGAPYKDQTAMAVPDAVPRAEPLSKYGNPESYTVYGKTYNVMPSSLGYREIGYASWYGRKFHGRRTSSGEIYDMYAMTAAHRTLPLPTYVRVRNLDNGREAIVRVNDRGPFHSDRIIDLSYAAATKLGLVEAGTAKVEVEAIDTGSSIAQPADPLPPPPPISEPLTTEPLPAQPETVLVDPLGSDALALPPADYGPPGGTGLPADPVSIYEIPDNTDSAGTYDTPSSIYDTPNYQPAPAQPAAPVYEYPVAGSGGPGTYLQAGAYSKAANANALADRLRGSGFNSVSVSQSSSDGLFKVRVGPYPGGNGLDADKRKLRSMGIRAFTVRQ